MTNLNSNEKFLSVGQVLITCTWLYPQNKAIAHRLFFLIPLLPLRSPTTSVCSNDIVTALSIIFCNRQQLSQRMFHMSKLLAFPTQPSHSYRQQILLGHMTSETKGRPLAAFVHTNSLVRKTSGINRQIKSYIELLADITRIDFLKLFLLIVRKQKLKDHLSSMKESVRPHCRHRFYHTCV